MKLGLTTNQWDLLWSLVDEGHFGEMDRESIVEFLGFSNRTINSLIDKGYLSWVCYANGEHISITDAGNHILHKFAENA